jgi:chromosome segregation ATPase
MAAPNPDELKKIKSLLDEISRVYSKLGENNPFAKFDTKNITDADAAVGQLNVGLRDAKKQLNEMTDGAQGLYAALKETVNELSKSNSSVKDSIRSFNKLSSLAQQLRDDQKGISELNMKDLKTMQSKLESEVQNLRVSTDSANLRKQELITKSSTVGLLPHERAEFIKINKTIAANNNLLNDQDSILEDLRNQVEERLELEGKIQRQMGLSGAIVGSFKKLLPGPLAEAMKIDEAVEKMPYQSGQQLDPLAELKQAYNFAPQRMDPLATAGVVGNLDRNKIGHYQMGTNKYNHLYGS